MKTKYKYIHFEQSPDGTHWKCCNNRTGDHLGTVERFKDWKQYEFSGGYYACFTACCLRDIAEFMDKLKELR